MIGVDQPDRSDDRMTFMAVPGTDLVVAIGAEDQQLGCARVAPA